MDFNIFCVMERCLEGKITPLQQQYSKVEYVTTVIVDVKLWWIRTLLNFCTIGDTKIQLIRKIGITSTFKSFTISSQNIFGYFNLIGWVKSNMNTNWSFSNDLCLDISCIFLMAHHIILYTIFLKPLSIVHIGWT